MALLVRLLVATLVGNLFAFLNGNLCANLIRDLVALLPRLGPTFLVVAAMLLRDAVAHVLGDTMADAFILGLLSVQLLAHQAADQQPLLEALETPLGTLR